MATRTSRSGQRPTVDYDDVGAIIAIASEMEDVDVDRLSLEDVRLIARELDVPEDRILPAMEELRRRREAMQAAEEEKRQRHRKVLRVFGGIAGGATVLVALWLFVGQASLGGELASIASYRAQVVNVLERQAATERQWLDLPHSERKSAELSGSENRVRIERKRYDDAAAAYNARLSSSLARLRARLVGHPTHVPLSNELGEF